MQTNNKVNIFALEIWDDEGDKCTFYTVKYDGADATETDNFFQKIIKIILFPPIYLIIRK